MSEEVKGEMPANPPADKSAEAVEPQEKPAVSPLEARLQSTLESYRALVRRTNPDILPEMITGETPEEIEQSLAKAKELVERLKSRLLEKMQDERVPVGVSRRDALEDLLPEEKIRRGVGNKYQ